MSEPDIAKYEAQFVEMSLSIQKAKWAQRRVKERGLAEKVPLKLKSMGIPDFNELTGEELENLLLGMGEGKWLARAASKGITVPLAAPKASERVLVASPLEKRRVDTASALAAPNNRDAMVMVVVPVLNGQMASKINSINRVFTDNGLGESREKLRGNVRESHLISYEIVIPKAGATAEQIAEAALQTRANTCGLVSICVCSSGCMEGGSISRIVCSVPLPKLSGMTCCRSTVSPLRPMLSGRRAK
jgi:hypothetical protein